MAHFAKLDANNIVEQVIVVNNDDIKDPMTGEETESIGVSFCQRLFGNDTKWKQTSYNGNFRGNYAGIGMTYAENIATLGVASTDVFLHPLPYPSWSIVINTALWYSPLGLEPVLTDSEKAAGKYYTWDEDAYQADTADPKTVGWALTVT